MDLNFSLLPSMPLKVLFTKNHVLKTLNRMVGLNASINTYLMLGELALLHQAKLPKSYWSYVILHATFIINCVTTPLLNNHSPFKKLHNTLMA
jgi:hypothetical protein